jgi:hypothetical protein
MRKVLGILMLMVCATLFIGLYNYVKNAKKEEKTFTVKNLDFELGNFFDTNVSDFVVEKLDNYDEVNLDLSVAKSESENFTKVGEYTFSVSYKDKEYNGKINIKDSIAPSLKLKSQVIKYGEKINIDSFIESCTDLSECKYEFENAEQVKKIKDSGKYEIGIKATDNFNNSVVMKTTLIIGDKPSNTNTNIKVESDTKTIQCTGSEYDDDIKALGIILSTFTFKNNELVSLSEKIVFQYVSLEEYNSVWEDSPKNGTVEVDGLKFLWQLDEAKYTCTLTFNATTQILKNQNWAEEMGISDYSYSSIMNYVKDNNLSCE